MNNSFFSRFAPKETRFFPLLKQLSEVLFQSSAIFLEGLDYSTAEERMNYYRRVKEMEREGDRLTSKILDELSKTFITPIDREDIHDLASHLDDVIDGINSCAKRIAIYNPHPISESGKELGKLINEAASYIRKSMDELEDFRSNSSVLRKYCYSLHDIENKADDVYELFVKKLFEIEKDPVEIMKIKEIMHEMEQTTDSAEYVGKILKTIIVKYA